MTCLDVWCTSCSFRHFKSVVYRHGFLLLWTAHVGISGILIVVFPNRVRIGKAPVEREVNPNRKTALELSMRAYIAKRDGNVVNPAVGTSFDSLDEAYQFYNLYSWEVGFGIRFAKSRLNVNRVKCMQEIVCGCAVCFLSCVSYDSQNNNHLSNLLLYYFFVCRVSR
jgi:hypothetical protein